MDKYNPIQIATGVLFLFQCIFLALFSLRLCDHLYLYFSDREPPMLGILTFLLQHGDNVWAYRLASIVITFLLFRWWTTYTGLEDLGRAYFVFFGEQKGSSFYQLYNEKITELIANMSLELVIAPTCLILYFKFVNRLNPPDNQIAR